MSKRPVDEDSDIDVSSSESENEMETQEMVDVDFDFFDLNPEIDFHSTKTFLGQLFGDDRASMDISGLADIILKENSVGTTIKTDGKESDPFAFITVVNIDENKTNPSIKKFIEYILRKTNKDVEFNMILNKLLGNKGQNTKNEKPKKVGWIFSERMINMPVEVVPPMYKMLIEEMEKAKPDFEFDYFIIVSKIYHIVAAQEMADEDLKKPKKTKKSNDSMIEMDYFHYEDIVLEQHSIYKGRYDYDETKQETDSRRVFTEYGIDPKLSVMLLTREGLEKSVPEMAEKFPAF